MNGNTQGNQREIKYGSVCSGIEAASIAWETLGWSPLWFSEIEKFPSAVLAHHWPDILNLGDMTKLAGHILSGSVEAPDVLVGGTPCQAFSIAGLRNGLLDTRGQLTLSYVELANAIDNKRRENGKPPAIIVWENVPGVLSSKDNAFGCFLAGLAGEDEPLQPAGKKWSNGGAVSGSSRTIAWRLLDAQYFGVAQRRRRVFVVASARNDFDPAKVFFEFNGLRRDTPPCREAQASVAALTASGVGTSGADDNQGIAGHLLAHPMNGSHWDNVNNPHPTLNQSNNIGGIGLSNQELFSQRGAGIVKGYRMAAFGEYADDETASTCKARDYKDATDLAVTTQYGAGIAGTLIARHDSSPCADRGMNVLAFPERMSSTQAASTKNLSPAIMSRNPTAIAFSYKDNGADATENLSPTLRAGHHDKSHANSGQPTAICYPINTKMALRGTDTSNTRREGLGLGNAGDPGFTLQAAHTHGVAYNMQVRRLTPVECERLQGFPDNHTLIPWRGKKMNDCPDGPRYKAIGNSMAVPVMRWIGLQIQKEIGGR